jgi:hypothetical protein
MTASVSIDKSIIKRVYVPTHVRELPNGERVTIPGHYREAPR